LRQAKENGIGYDEFLLGLTGAELQTRAENSLARRIREAKFPLVKTLETFDLSAVPDLDIRLIRELAGGDYIRERRNVIFRGIAARGRLIWLPPWASKPAKTTSAPVLSPAAAWSMS